MQVTRGSLPISALSVPWLGRVGFAGRSVCSGHLRSCRKAYDVRMRVFGSVLPTAGGILQTWWLACSLTHAEVVVKFEEQEL